MKKLLLSLAILPAILACGFNHKPTVAESLPEHKEANSVYYWKTVFQLDSAALDFLSEHDVQRMYLRMFDVTADEEWGARPNATIRIAEREARKLPDSLEIVPVVYITLDGLREMAGKEGELAENMVTRIKNMCSYNELRNVSELQLDCDWTNSTEESFFALCDSVKSQFRAQELPWRLSSTIRLHQLRGKVPPVDNGVLMVYNTGSFSDPDTRNSIIDLQDIDPYLKKLKDYPLHLDVAYPAYSWLLVFYNRHFVGLTNGLELNDSTKFVRRGENLYEVPEDLAHNQRVIRRGSMIRKENSEFSTIDSVKTEIEKRLNGKPHSNIIYHLDPENLKNYSSDEIESIYSVGR